MEAASKWIQNHRRPTAQRLPSTKHSIGKSVVPKMDVCSQTHLSMGFILYPNLLVATLTKPNRLYQLYLFISQLRLLYQSHQNKHFNPVFNPSFLHPAGDIAKTELKASYRAQNGLTGCTGPLMCPLAWRKSLSQLCLSLGWVKGCCSNASYVKN